MSAKKLSIAEARKLRVELERIDHLFDSIKQKFGEIPTYDELADYASECGTIAQRFQQANEAWSELPNEDDVKEYASTASDISTALKAAAN